MNKLNLINNPELFQGEKLFKKCKNYFEGWYFKNTYQDNGISFIPGVHIENGKKSSFIQVITNDNSYFIPFDFKDFKFSHSPFYIKIKNNFFSLDKIIIDISFNDFYIKGTLNYSKSSNIKTSPMNPNIMGPFSFLTFMECNHAILSMKHCINGSLKLNNELLSFDNGIGYIEKDWGCSFPKSYIWEQANSFENSDSSFFVSIANIPILKFNFTGLICVLKYNDKEYRFATYNGSKIKKYEIKDNNNIHIVLEHLDKKLEIKSKCADSFCLKSPKNGNMKNTVFESINSKIYLTLKENNKIIFEDVSSNCGLEIG